MNTGKFKGLIQSRWGAPVKRFLFAMMMLVLAAAAAACGNDHSGAEGKVRITATTGMIGDVALNVGGEHVNVISLMKSGVDPHVYKASQGDIRRLEQADVILYNGLHLEAKMTEILDNMSRSRTVVAVGEGLNPEDLLEGDLEQGEEFDPHIWFDVRKWMQVTQIVRDELVRFDPDNRSAYEANAAAYLQQLEELHQYALNQIASIPEQSRVLVTAHDAFGYFGEAYGIEVMGLQGISTAAEAGARDIADLRDYLVENRIKAVFVESSVSKRSIQAVINGAKQMGHEVVIGGELYSDAMGKAGTPEGTYIGMFRHNIDTIVQALK